MMIQEIIPNVFRVAGFVNVYIIRGDDNSLNLIDTGLSMIYRSLMDGLKQVGYPSIPIKSIYITHADVDHCGLANRFSRETGIIPHTSSIEAAAMAIGEQSRPLVENGVLQRVMFKLVTRAMRTTPTTAIGDLAQGVEIDLLGGLQVLETPGHTPGHISFYSSSKQILFCGDSITDEHGQPAPSGNGNTWDSLKAQKSFDAQMALRPKYICGGHCYYENL